MLGDVLGSRTAEVADILDTGEASVKGALQRARATLQARLPSADRERAPQPNSASELGDWSGASPTRSRTATSTTWSPCSPTTPCSTLSRPQPSEQGHDAIAAFMRQRAQLRDAPLRFVPTLANTQPAFGSHLADAHAAQPHADQGRPR